MIIDTLVVVVCLMADTPRIQEVLVKRPSFLIIQDQTRPKRDCNVPGNHFTVQFQRADSLFNIASDEAMKSAMRKTRFERYRALGIITNSEYCFLKQGEKELEEMEELKRNTVKP